ncbi:MAG: tetratricopeptide repeat protein [Acidobacteriia bacterium]|nr:tetratricopeptide repeat protein [Terriglobia bacterium]
MGTSKLISAILLAALSGRPALNQASAPAKKRPQAATQTRPADSLQEAETLLQSQQYAQAEEKLLVAVTAAANNPQAWFDLGFAQSHLDKTTAAITSYRKAVELSPKWFEANLNLGVALARSGDTAGAVPVLKQAVELTPTTGGQQARGRAWLALAEALENAGNDAKGAAAAYDKAFEFKAGGPEMLVRAGVLLGKAGDAAGAESHLRKAAEAGDSAGMAQLINLLAGQKRYADAEVWLSKYLDQNPQDASARVQYARLLASEGKNTEAIAALQAAGQPAGPVVAKELADLYLANKQYKEAEAVLQPLVDNDQRDPQLHLDLGIALLYQLKYAAAESELVKALQLKSDMPEAYGYLADAARENNHYELAIRCLDARAKFLPETPRTIFIRATSYDNLRMYKPAAENYKKFLAVSGGKYPDQEFQARHRLKAIEP